MDRAHLSRAVVVALASAALLTAATAPVEAQFRPPGLTFVPQAGVAFHGDVYDDRTITTFAGSDAVQVNRVTVDPGVGLRFGGRVEYDFAPGFRLNGGVGLSWPGADVRIDDATQRGVDVSVLELNGGATLELGEITADRLPLYAGAEVGIVRHGFDEFRWSDEFIDPSSTSLTVGGRVGVEYPVLPSLSLRGELKQTLAWGAFGDFEEDIAAVETRQAGSRARVDFEGNTFSLPSLNVGVALSF